MKRSFHYYTGQIVCVGDRVKTDSGHFGVVLDIIYPNTKDATDNECPEGAIRIVQDWDVIESAILLEPPDGEFWEDFEFLGRNAGK